ncbi:MULTISPECIES: FMN-binding protein [unclassified Mesorhizobium]|uniref:FMN-binding protein n=1 Tax=unclassified Mesorhizobium TaxID=325217 RepID=UPI001CC96DC5|nr:MULTISPECIES: FMN-binding protein [unclassified Mesorhizobium]MCA0008721.1 FMN-binding protein [Mesorhizobium sp. B264B1B]MCA0019401.1 FMN-binding protein [Mesorhizobium sp. B264B1A]MCA0024558.1 FMN-binding protein [Mesorhizobium sp. B263B1A]MCA0055770.1 FMN-binding protein [Mesorhizobium sp. B261B1A]UCI16540.1 FMN-binding protein [Mesorhizobium sp. B2-1-1]
MNSADSQLSAWSWDIASGEQIGRPARVNVETPPMKQIALSLFVIAASGAYVWDQAGKDPANDMLGEALPADAAEAPSAQPKEPAPFAATLPAPLDPRFRTRFPIAPETTAGIAVPAERTDDPVKQTVVPVTPQPSRALLAQPVAPAASDPAPSVPSFAVTPAVYIPVPQPRPAYRDAPARVVRVDMKIYADGVYTGPTADAYYGIIQIQALIQGGQLKALKVLKYPSDRRTSININRQALPMLRDEAISAQSANVDIISGATLTSRAFIQSLRGALKKATS